MPVVDASLLYTGRKKVFDNVNFGEGVVCKLLVFLDQIIFFYKS
jgi:hypothetical protein